MDDAAALTARSHLVHDFRAVDGAEGLAAEKVFPDVRDGSAARSSLRCRALEKKSFPITQFVRHAWLGFCPPELTSQYLPLYFGVGESQNRYRICVP
jgi:hypothetical protein